VLLGAAGAADAQVVRQALERITEERNAKRGEDKWLCERKKTFCYVSDAIGILSEN